MRSVTTGVVALSPTGRQHARRRRARRARVHGAPQPRSSTICATRVSQGTSAKADFLSNISHELRTPVTVAKGIAYVLRNPSVPDEERAEFLEQLQGSLDKLMGMVDEIITMSELERGTLRARRRRDRPRGRRPTCGRGRSSAAPVGPRSRPRSPALLPTIADEERLEGVVSELLDNACRYSPAGAPVEVTARAMAEGIVVSVTDRGEGLDRTVAKRSFDEPFSTGEGVLRKEKAGVGVGLHLARQLVIEHGGTLWTDPLPGGGTRAAFCIPPVASARQVARPTRTRLNVRRPWRQPPSWPILACRGRVCDGSSSESPSP